MSFLYLVLIGLGNRPKMLGLVCALNSGIGFILFTGRLGWVFILAALD